MLSGQCLLQLKTIEKYDNNSCLCIRNAIIFVFCYQAILELMV